MHLLCYVSGFKGADLVSQGAGLLAPGSDFTIWASGFGAVVLVGCSYGKNGFKPPLGASSSFRGV